MKSLLIFITFFICNSSYARSLFNDTHNFSFSFGNTQLSSDQSSYDRTGTLVGYSYHYFIKKSASLGISYLKGNSDDCYLFCLVGTNNNRHRFTDKQISYKHHFKISKRNSFYIQGGLDSPKSIEYNPENETSSTDQSLGFHYGLGWHFKSDKGLTFGASIIKLEFDKIDIESSVFTIGLAF